ncbi:MAG: Flp pilus assembly protein CpaB [Eggerthellaceae bacterium]|nr:Flp pilus assembly protein CpaB [Eggerthellaceae bacterium]MDR2721939.1 Flp pilus assembly protein CpaB [Coriobacteriaceae bacterium]
MKRQKTILWGILSGLICAGSVFFYTQGVQNEAATARAEALARYGGEQLEICVATRDISAGDTVDVTNIATRLWVADLLPEDAVRSLADINGKQATSTILAGEVVSMKRFEESLSSVEVPVGFSALSVPAKEVQTIGGALCAGMHVDVYATGVSTELLAENILVVSTSAETSEKKAGASIAWVTLAVKPSSVQEIIAASQKMELYFVLPSSSEKGSTR